MNFHKLAFRISAVFWVIWGLVHTFAGGITISKETAAAVQGIADAVDPALIVGPFPPAVGGLINQHGFNLLWIGIVTTIAGVFIWRERARANALFLAALVGGLADLGYFLFIDLAGFARFVPGTVMTIVSASAIALSFYAHFKGSQTSG